jgi:drug/metabolite transporter (DMT)-like permease
LFFLLMRHSKARDVNRASATIYGNLIGVLVCAPAFIGAVRRGISPVDFGCIAYLGIVQLGLAYLLFTSAMARGVRSIDASIIGYVEPVLNPVWVFLFIGERPSGWALVGGAIIIASVIVHMIVETRSKAAKRLPPDLTAHA